MKPKCHCFIPLILLAALLVVERTIGQQTFEENPQPINLRVLETIRVTSLNGGIPLPVTFKGGLYHFVLDTGSSMTVFDEKLRPLLGDPIGTEYLVLPGHKDPLPQTSYAAPDAKIGSLSLEVGGPVVCMNLEAVRQKTNTKISGVVGMSFLKHYLVRMNFDEMVITISEELDERHEVVLRDELGSEFRCPEALIVLPTGEELFTLDTGDDSVGSIREATYDKLVEMGVIVHSPEKTTVASGNGMIQVESGTYLKPFSFCGIDHLGLPFRRSSPSRLGLAFISQYNLLCHFPKGEMQLEPIKKWRPATAQQTPETVLPKP